MARVKRELAGGGVWYETPAGSYGIMGPEAAWETNVAFLRQQMAAGIPKLEFTGINVAKEREAFAVAQAVNPAAKASSRVKEIMFLTEEAPKYGYKQVGDAWVKQ